jgi:hypothetical protein
MIDVKSVSQAAVRAEAQIGKVSVHVHRAESAAQRTGATREVHVMSGRQGTELVVLREDSATGIVFAQRDPPIVRRGSM